MKCPICSSKTEIKINNVRSYYSIEEFQIRICNNCDLSFTKVNNKKFDQKKLYKNIYDYSVHESTKSEKLWRIENTFSKVSKKLDLNSKSIVLDIGCMQGFFLEYLKKKFNCKVLGIETEDYYLRKKNKNLNIIKSDLYNFSQKKINQYNFDLIIMSHTFEHFSEPMKVLNCLNKLLSKNGMCLIIVPNIDSSMSNFFKRFWGWLQPPAHFFHYSKKSLSKIFHNANFRYTLINENGGDSLLLALSFINIMKFNYTKSSKSKNKRLRNLLVSVFSSIFKYIYYFGNDELVYLIKKNDSIKNI